MARTIKVFDADGHITEPPDMWEQYIEPKFRNSCPKIFIEDDGAETFRIDENLSFQTVVAPLKASIATSTGWGLRDGDVSWKRNYMEGEQGGFDPHKRIQWMDGEGFDASVLFPTMALVALWETYDPERSAAVTDAYNRFVIDFCAPYPDRLFGAACIPLLSAEDAVRQVKEASDAGLRLGCFRPNPVGGKPLHHQDFYPVWQECEARGLAVAVHGTAGPHNIGSDRFASKVRTMDGDLRKQRHISSFAMEHCFTHAAEMMAAVTSFVMGGICDKFPNLKVGFIEAGGAWVPGYVDRMDRHFDDKGANDTGLSTRPSEIFQRQCFTGFEPVETSIALLAGRFGANKLMLSSDYPHSDGFPHSLRLIEKMDLPEQVKADLCCAGAKEWLGLA
jgi:predicted TIM-barrel fold metal-dependent hydrolase